MKARVFKATRSDEKYGLTYQGSKSKIIDKIARFFPNADHFYDLFGGGFSVSHYMIENRSRSYKHFHFNEIRSVMCELIQDAIAGKYNYDIFKPEWISRERFFREKESNAYIKILYSFGNNGNDYLFGKELEPIKRSMHQAVVFNEFDQFMIDTFKIDRWPNSMDITGKRLYLRMICRKEKRQDIIQLQELQQLERLERRQQLEQLQRLERLQRLQGIQRIERINFSNLDYSKVNIQKNSVIYCDIPYFGTTSYGNTFSHQDFFNWSDAQSNPVFISEYEIKDSRLHLIKEFSHRSTFSTGGRKNIPVTERLYGNSAAFDIIEKARSLK